MPDPTIPSRDTITNAKAICADKLAILFRAHGPGDIETKELKARVDLVFNSPNALKPGMQLPANDNAEIGELILSLSPLDQDDLAGIVVEMRKLLGLLEQNVPQVGTRGLPEDEPLVDHGMNQKVVGALLTCENQIIASLTAFIKAGQNLLQDPSFKSQRDEQVQHFATYRKQLQADAIGSTEDDRKKIVLHGTNIAASPPNAVTFKMHHGLLTAFVKSKSGTV